ncbi:MAG: hypothetical protein OEW42_09380 [Acidimicrobiia bacterium]|nr:hypothetical protein [Acidimicrobiia bacterium]MDH5236251.1 hypothetical protein [Acidimicrobiia bacterium]
MCSTCTTALDALGTNAVVVAVVAANGWERLKDRAQRRPRLERQLDTWRENADFMRTMGLDPLGTLGAPPTVDLPLDATAQPATA